MPSEPFTIYTGKYVNVSQVVTSNNKFIVDVTPTVQNPDNQTCNSILLDLEYSGFTPNPDTTSPGWKIRAVIESSNGSGSWHPIGVQFEPLQHPSQGARQIIIIQPNIINFDEGIPVDVWDGQAVATRINRQQGVLGIDFRVVLEVIETKYGTLDALQGFTVKMIGERYNA